MEFSCALDLITESRYISFEGCKPTTSQKLLHCLGTKDLSAMAVAMKLLFLLVCSYHSLLAHARHGPNYRVLATGSPSPDAACTELKAVLPSSGGGAVVPLHHRHGPCSPLPSKEMPSLDEMLRRDQLRAGYIQRMLSAGTNGTRDRAQQSEATVPTSLGSSLDTLEYVITVGIGSPAATQTMLIDTGSDVSWVQCEPCPECSSQVDALFDPSSSSTYSPFTCDSAACTQLGPEGNGCSSSQQCQYIVHYADRSSTTGTYTSDTLTLGSYTISSFQFGCSHAASGHDDKTDGLMGLGGGPQSLVSQMAGTFGTAFSYCLPPTPASTGFLTLGASSGGADFVTTPMIRNDQIPTYYQVALEAIVVDGTQLDVPPSVFSGGSVMDSGTVITWLPPTAYSALSSAFRAGMAQYPPAQGRGAFDTCFDFSGLSGGGGVPSVPPVSLVFAGGAVVNLDVDGIMLGNCLAFTATKDDNSGSIIGNVQQRTFEVLYDVGQSTVGFRAGAC
ncbi:hypothetical protein GQ55_6G086300 [Panicum hallii var. hallii]|uniref:Peptidase A1 domain-containing protein n=1 Tax=Panicum hallii var. hallii TaxID=1504633 RepID=A0A2T7D595_9POAL|nr:hypothetical protein GQ55_6G086300 [Panicum hallii var. hallii]